jgi:hypothetical protein
MCSAGVLVFAVDPIALLAGTPYRTDGFVFDPKCLVAKEGYCQIAVVKYAPEPSGKVNGTGYFVYQSGFGVVSFGTIDPRSGTVDDVYSYRDGAPILGAR